MWTVPRRIVNLYKGELEDIFKAIVLGKLIFGQESEQFRKQFGDFVGASSVFTVSSGRVALKIILQSLRFPLGSEVIVPAYTAAEVPEMVSELGLEPVFVDIKASDHNIDPGLIEAKITERTKAIIATHIFGIPCDLEQIISIAQRHALIIIEDCAHAMGARYKGRKVGSFGLASFYSFANLKPFSTFGGGAICTNDSDFAGKIKMEVDKLPQPSKSTIIKSILISYFLYFLTKPAIFSLFVYPLLRLSDLTGKDFSVEAYSAVFKKSLKSVRREAKLANIQALVGLKHLRFYKQYCNQRNSKVRLLGSKLLNVQYLSSDNNDITAVPYFFIIASRNAQELSSSLLKKGIDTGRNLMRYCPQRFGSTEDYPRARQALETSVQIPLHKFVDQGKVAKIAEAVNVLVLKKVS